MRQPNFPWHVHECSGGALWPCAVLGLLDRLTLALVTSHSHSLARISVVRGVVRSVMRGVMRSVMHFFQLFLAL